MLTIDDARAYARLEEEALKRLLLRRFLRADLSTTTAWTVFAGPAPRDVVLALAFSGEERRQLTDEWRELANRLGLQGVLLERNGSVNKWLDPALDQVRRWFRSAKGFARARARRQALDGAVSEHLHDAVNALLPHARQAFKRREVAPWRAFVHSDERDAANRLHALGAPAAEACLVEAIIALGGSNLRMVPVPLRAPNVLRACLMSARSSMSLDLTDGDQSNLIAHLLADLAKLHPPVIDEPATRAHLVTIVYELIRAERFLANELRWELLRSNHGALVDVFKAMNAEDNDVVAEEAAAA